MKQPSTSTLLVRGGVLVTPQGLLEADLLAQGERIQAIGQGLPALHDTRVVDAKGCYVLPGVIDAHTHIALDTGIYQTADDWFTGTQAAACGGVTTVIDFATQFSGQSLQEAVEARLEEAREAVVDYGFHVMITDLPPDREGELADLVALGAPSIKLYTTYRIKGKRSGSYRPNYYADDATLLRLMKAAADLGILPLVHCENDTLVTAQTEALAAAGETDWSNHGRSRPALAEQEAIQRVLFLAEAAGSPVHICHCSTARSVALVIEARDKGQSVTCETCPQYLLLDNTLYRESEPWRYILQPPLRDPDESVRLWAMVEAGAVDMLVTDHCDYTKTQKTAQDDFTQTPGGLPGMETLLPLMFTYGVAEGQMKLSQLVELLSTNPAQIWGLWPQKGALLPGSDADIVVYDPEPEGTITADDLHHRAGYTPYEGLWVQGQVRATISRGQIVYRKDRFVGRKGQGQFVKRTPLD
jgi:dihydropyrimidinase